MKRVVPPLNPLHVFEVAARLASFTRAAEELNVTQSAISRQIGVLEGYLNVSLFHRQRVGVTLTPEGKTYLRSVGPAFEAIYRATEEIRRDGKERPVFVRVYPTFAVKWLIPRLPDFNAAHRDIEISITTGTQRADFEQEQCVLVVSLLPDDDPPPCGVRLFGDLIQPVCSPKLLKCEGYPESLDDLANRRLLTSGLRRSDWHRWFEAKGRGDLRPTGAEFPSSVLTYQAATEGLGIAIGQVSFLDDDLSSQKLVGLFGPPVMRPLSYYAVWSQRRGLDARARSFLRWLQRQSTAVESSQSSLLESK